MRAARTTAAPTPRQGQQYQHTRRNRAGKQLFWQEKEQLYGAEHQRHSSDNNTSKAKGSISESSTIEDNIIEERHKEHINNGDKHHRWGQAPAAEAKQTAPGRGVNETRDADEDNIARQEEDAQQERLGEPRAHMHSHRNTGRATGTLRRTQSANTQPKEHRASGF